MRGVSPRGLDNMGGTARGYDGDYVSATNGRNLGSYQADDYKAHYHALKFHMIAGSSGSAIYPVGFSGSIYNSDSDGTTVGVQNAGGSETRGKNLALNYIIKY
jgi:hypothetical protein